MRIQFAKGKSDIIAKMDGSFIEKVKRKTDKRKAEDNNEKRKPVQKKQATGVPKTDNKKKADSKMEGTTTHLQPKQQPPNKILFVENLPEAATDLMVSMLFQQFPGFKEVRMVSGKSGIAFVEFENEIEAGFALSQLQHFKITPTNLMVISYAKK